MQSDSKTAYRPDIDGLRAIAVSLVVVTHAGLFGFLAGGFIGVDVFFVISGYLISTILLREIAQGRFSIVGFYRRRVLRIAPALMAMLAVVSIFALLFLLPTELTDYAGSAIAAIGFVSNIFFWLQTGYFDHAALDKPLLHTWSLAIEEQFYVLFPLFLYFVHRHLRGALKPLVAGLIAVSLAASIWAVWKNPDNAFYLVQYRTWELLLGTAVALDFFKLRPGPFWRNVMTLCGLAMIVAPAFLYNRITPFPGAAALPPCLGTALIIQAGLSGESAVSRLLSLKPVVGLGLVSYSLYLWHWPLLVFLGTGMPFLHMDHPKAERAVLMLVALAISIASWRYVESPFRHGHMRNVSSGRIFVGAAMAASLVAALSFGFILAKGIPSRFPARAVAVAAYLNYDLGPNLRSGTCFVGDVGSRGHYDYGRCLKQYPEKKNYLLLGESNAAHLYPGLVSRFPDAQISQATSPGCKPVLRQYAGASAYCARLMAYILNDYLPAHHVDRLLIAALWADQDLPALQETLNRLAARHIDVVLFGPMPRYNIDLPRLLVQSLRQGNDQALRAGLIPLVAPLDKRMKQMAAAMNVKYVSLFDLLCPGGVCKVYVSENEPLQSDTVHLTKEGSEYVASLVARGGYLK